MLSDTLVSASIRLYPWSSYSSPILLYSTTCRRLGAALASHAMCGPLPSLTAMM